MWPKDAEHATGIPHGDLNVALSGEARAREGWFAFEERSPHGVILSPRLLQFIEAMGHKNGDTVLLVNKALCPRFLCLRRSLYRNTAYSTLVAVRLFRRIAPRNRQSETLKFRL
jgi:hypothetical protein